MPDDHDDVNSPSEPRWAIFNNPYDKNERIAVNNPILTVSITDGLVRTGIPEIFGSGATIYYPEGPVRVCSTMEEAVAILAGSQNRDVTLRRHSEGEIRLVFRPVTATRHDKMTAAAVWLANHGAKVGWGPVSHGKAVNRRWKSDLTGDPALIPVLLGGAKNSVIVATGRMVIIDVDAYGWYERLKAAGLPETFTVMSPTVRRTDTSKEAGPDYDGQVFRGVHIYLFAPPDYDVLTIPGAWEGGETRRSESGEQSMVLGPWSMRPDGVYEPVPGCPRVIAEAPRAVFDLIVAHPTKIGPQNGADGALIVVGADPDGEWTYNAALHGSRHDLLRDRIRAWRGFDADPDSLKKRIVEYIDKHAIPLDRPGGESIDDAELDRMIVGALKKYADDPPSVGQSETQVETESGETIVIDPLAIESRIDHPPALDLRSFYIPIGLAKLMDHLVAVTDAPDSSLALASCVTMSALAGTKPTLEWRGHHRAALFGCLVGHSNYGRKGATMREVAKAFRQVDPLFDDIEVSGIASGEVLVDILNEAKQNSIGTALIWEHEIANVLILAAREGNIMSGNLRRAWDGDKVESRSRAKGRSFALGYNVAFMGGVTPLELEQRLTANDIANGWANRFLWFWSEKAPRLYGAGAWLDDPTRDYLSDCIDFARNLTSPTLLGRPMALPTMVLTPAAKARLTAMSDALDVPPIGAIGALRQRMPLHVVRLAMVAALFDQSTDVDEMHVEFGERMAAYAIDSMRAVFGIRVSDPVSMYILSLLYQVPDGWMGTNDLRKATGKDHPRIQTALRALLAEGLIVREERPTKGRPSVGYRLLRGGL